MGMVDGLHSWTLFPPSLTLPSPPLLLAPRRSQETRWPLPPPHQPSAMPSFSVHTSRASTTYTERPKVRHKRIRCFLRDSARREARAGFAFERGPLPDRSASLPHNAASRQFIRSTDGIDITSVFGACTSAADASHTTASPTLTCNEPRHQIESPAKQWRLGAPIRNSHPPSLTTRPVDQLEGADIDS